MPLIDRLAECAERIWIYGLSILNNTDQNWQNVAGILDNHFPGKKRDIEQAVFSRDHAYWDCLRHDLELLQVNSDAQLSVHV